MSNTRNHALSSLLLAAAVSAAAGAAVPPESITLLGVIRDFPSGDMDFGFPGGAPSPSAGNLATSLDSQGLPVFTGQGYQVIAPALDLGGNLIAPHIADGFDGFGGLLASDFEIIGGVVVPTTSFVARFTVLGCGYAAGSYLMPVTCRFQIGADVFQPFGSLANPIQGTVNDANNPRTFTTPGEYAAGSAVSVVGRGYRPDDFSDPGTNPSDFSVQIEADSLTGTQQVYALRNGDPVPSTPGYDDQTALAGFVSDYVDAAAGVMTLADNQVIWVFELWTTDLSDATADFQDLVVLVDLAVTAPTACTAIADVPAAKGAPSSGDVTSVESFSKWFANDPMRNASKAQEITLMRNAQGDYQFDTDNWAPIDNQLFGNGSDAHNKNFTFSMTANFTAGACTGQFFELATSGDAWLFIDGQLVMDLGGMGARAGQYVELDRFGFADGTQHTISLFYAQRSADNADFHIRTNVPLRPTGLLATPTGAFYD